MADLDGGVFVAIDSDAFGDGEADTLPLDSLIEGFMRANHKHLQNGIDVATWTPPVYDADDYTAKGQTRPHCSLEWATICPPFWLLLQPGMSVLEIGGLMRVGDEGTAGISETNDFQIKIEIIGITGARRQEASTIVGSGNEWNDFRWVVPILQPLEVPLWTVVRIMGKSEPGSTIGSSGSVTPTVRTRLSDGGSVYSTPTGTSPNNTAHDVMCTQLTDADGHVVYVDHIYYHETEDWMAINPPPPSWETLTAQKYSLNYVQVMGLNFRTLYNYDAAGHHARLPLAEIRPKISNTGQTASKHAFNADHLNRRARLVYVGPNGWTDGTSTAEVGTGNYNDTIYWPFVDGDASATVLEDTFLRPWRGVLTDNGSDPNFGSLRLDLMFIPTHLTDEFYGRFVSLNSSRTRVLWDITVEILQMPSTTSPTDWGDAVSLASETRTVQFNAWPTDNFGTYPFLQQMCWSRFNDESIDYGYTFKEGMLYEDDLSLTQTETFTLAMDGSSAESEFPVRVKISAELSATPSSLEWGFTPPGGGQQTAEFLRLSLVGASGHWLPLNQ